MLREFIPGERDSLSGVVALVRRRRHFHVPLPLHSANRLTRLRHFGEGTSDPPPPIELPAPQITSTEESATSAFGAPVCWYRELRSVGLSDQIREVSPR